MYDDVTWVPLTSPPLLRQCPLLALQGVDALVGSLPGLRTVEIGATLEGASVVPPELVGQAATAS